MENKWKRFNPLLYSITIHFTAAILLWYFSDAIFNSNSSLQSTVSSFTNLDSIEIGRSQQRRAHSEQSHPQKNAESSSDTGDMVSAKTEEKNTTSSDLDVALGEGDRQKMSVADYRKYVVDHNPQPDYPRMARIKGEQGGVELFVRVNAQGQLVSAEFLKRSGFESLDQNTLNTVKSWDFPVFSGNLTEISFNLSFHYGLD